MGQALASGKKRWLGHTPWTRRPSCLLPTPASPRAQYSLPALWNAWSASFAGTSLADCPRVLRRARVLPIRWPRLPLQLVALGHSPRWTGGRSGVRRLRSTLALDAQVAAT